tara:strand:- start:1875 stop:3095 length:1221 start_codon:yes stop_codon:yes gene_type:complete
MLLVSGPFLSDLAVVLICIFFIHNTIKEKNFKVFLKIEFLIICSFCIYLVINSIFINYNLNSIKISLSYIRFGIFVLAIQYILIKNPKVLKYMSYCFFIVLSILIIDGFKEYFTGSNVFNLSKPHPFRVSSFFGDELILGSFISRLFPIFFGISLFYFFQKKISLKIFSLIIVFILAEVLVFLSGERASLFYINFSTLFILFMIQKGFLIRLSMFLTALMIILIIGIINPTAKNRVIDKTIDEFQIKIEDKRNTNQKYYIFTKVHTEQYNSAYKMFKNNKVFGVGVKGFKNNCNKKEYKILDKYCSTHPHNTYIQILSETGIIGFIYIFSIFIMLLFFSIKHFYFKLQKKFIFDDLEICLLSAFWITLWPFIPTGNFFSNWLSIIYYLPLGIFLWSIRYKKNSSNI